MAPCYANLPLPKDTDKQSVIKQLEVATLLRLPCCDSYRKK